MKKNQFTFILVLVLILLMQSCYDYSKTRRSKEFQTNFLKNESQYNAIKDFLINNTDSIFSITSPSDTLCCYVYKENTLNEIGGGYKKLYINEILIFKNSVDRELFKSIHQFMIEQNIAKIAYIENRVTFGFLQKKSPCFELIWREQESTENINTLIKVKNDHADYWKYNFDKNWYIIGISCFI